MWPALVIRSPSLKFLLLSLAQRQISSLLNIIFSYKSFLHLCCNVKIPRLATPCYIFRDVTRMSYILLSFPIGTQKPVTIIEIRLIHRVETTMRVTCKVRHIKDKIRLQMTLKRLSILMMCMLLNKIKFRKCPQTRLWTTLPSPCLVRTQTKMHWAQSFIKYW